MANAAISDAHFSNLISVIHQETNSFENKLEILFSSRGFFNAHQAATLLLSFARPGDKVRAIQILEPRLLCMTCQEARSIIDAVSIHNDKLIVLDCIKRVLGDYQTKLGEEYILSAFPFENDKQRALSILNTVHSDVVDKVPAGGHQGYAALGGLYTQARPLAPHLYGDLAEQACAMAGHGKIEIPQTAQPAVLPSLYKGHPSYTYPPDKSYAEVRGYPGNKSATDVNKGLSNNYPTGAPVLGHHSGAPAPTGFPTLDSMHVRY